MNPATCILIASLGAAAAVHAQPVWSAVAGGPNAEIRAFHVFDGKLFVAGSFAGTPTVTSRNLVAWTGTQWVEGPGIPSSSLLSCFTIFPVNAAPRLVVGGSFEFLSPFDGVAVLVNGVWTPTAPGPQSWVSGLGVFDAGGAPELFVGGGFSIGSPYVTRYVGAQFVNAAQGLISASRVFCQFDDGQGPRLYAGWPPDGDPFVNRVGVWNGSTWTGIGTGTQMRTRPEAMAVYNDGSGPALFMGGRPEITNMSSVVKFKNSTFSTPGAGVIGLVQAMVVFDDGFGPGLVVAGDITSANAVPVNRIAMWRDGQWSSLGSGLTGGRVNALAVFDDDGPGPTPPALYAGGLFTTAGGVPAPFIARYGYCAADLTLDGQVDFNDYLEFLNAYNSGLPRADFNADATVDFNDYLEFLNYFNDC